MKTSLRAQLIAWLIFATVILAFGATFLTRGLVTRNMEKAFDDALQKRAHMVAAVISSDLTADEASYARVRGDLAQKELPFVPLVLRVISPAGRTIIEYGKLTATIEESLDSLIVNAKDGRYDTISVNSVQPFRAYTVSVLDARTSQVLAFVQIVDSLDQLENAKKQFLVTSAVVATGGSMLAMAIGLVLVRRGFRPFGAILKAINEINYEHLKISLRQEPRVTEMELLAKSLVSMSRRLDSAASEKQKFIGGVSHDLRTPLTVLQGQLEVLLKEPGLMPETRQSLERMLDETRRLIRLVRNLLLSVQLESRPSISSQPVNLSELVDEVAGNMLSLAEGRKFKFAVADGVITHGDRDLLTQMLMNIIHNSIKFTPNVGGKIEIKLTTREEWVIFEVSDNGAGIPAVDLPHVTEAFFESKVSRRPADEGTRLGLSIVKRISELHGGRLEIQSEEHVGTSFRVLLPKADRALSLS